MTLSARKRQLYDFSAESLDGTVVSLERYRGRVTLIVNTASIGKQRKHLGRLEALYEAYSQYGFAILAFPCGQFGDGEYTTIEEVMRSYYSINGVRFDVFAPVIVNGPFAHPLFMWLQKRKSGQFGPKIEWNYAKFLFSRDGAHISRYTQWRDYDHIGKKVFSLLSAGEGRGLIERPTLGQENAKRMEKSGTSSPIDSESSSENSWLLSPNKDSESSA